MNRRLTAILTHTHPDLDATLSTWLLRKFGAAKYEGVVDLPIRFLPAGLTPGNRHPDELELEEGILAVDTGGGRLDTHARDGVFDEAKKDKSAALLVAEDLGVADHPALQKLLNFVTLQEIKGRSIASKEPMDHLVSLPSLVRGLNTRYPDDPMRVTTLVHELYEAAYTTELEWFQAIEDFKTAQVVTLAGQNPARLVAVHSDTGAAVKVARLNKADLIVHRNTVGHTGITARHNGLLARIDLVVLAEVLRVAESVVEDAEIDYSRVRMLGMSHGWFLHDSGKILSKGSPKNREVAPSRLPLEEVLALSHARLDPAQPMPQRFCALARDPNGACDGCPFDPLGLETCAAQRKRARKAAAGQDRGRNRPTPGF